MVFKSFGHQLWACRISKHRYLRSEMSNTGQIWSGSGRDHLGGHNYGGQRWSEYHFIKNGHAACQNIGIWGQECQIRGHIWSGSGTTS